MGKYKRYKNKAEMFLASRTGKRTLNFVYSWGASVVILGAMFKILHLPYGNTMLAVGMITEFFVFFIFGFERPNSEYHWEDVFPVLKSKNPMDRPDFAQGGGNGGGGVVGQVAGGASFSGSTAFTGQAATAAAGVGGGVFIQGNGVQGGGVQGGGSFAGTAINLPQGDTKNLSDSIQKLLEAADQIAKIPELTNATQKYLEQLSKISEGMERFGNITDSLADVSNGIHRNTAGYVQQMETLNRNVAGLNTIYELQLKSISSQISSIEHINAGLNRIKDLYDGSVVDSSVFRSETEKMAQQLAQL
ncbi:MAG: gliding motility protein GldL, partial [Tannerella sp.]|nr:gliding motility protein GldL [Tannerella sp.]